MQQKAKAFIFYSLLLTAFANGIKDHFKEKSQEIKAHLSRGRHLEHICNEPPPRRVYPPRISTLNVTGSSGNSSGSSGSTDIELVIHATSETISSLNQTSNASVTLDLNATLIATIDLVNNTLTIFNLTNGTGIYISAANLNINLTTRALINISLSQIAQNHNGTRFSCKNVSQHILEAIASVLLEESVELSIELNTSSTYALDALLRVAISLSAVLTQHVSSGTVSTRYDVVRLPHVIEAAREAVSNLVTGGASTLKRNNISVDQRDILASTSTIEIVLIVVRTVSTRLDVDDVLNPQISDKLYLLKLIVELSMVAGNSDLIDSTVAVLVALYQRDGANTENFLYVLVSNLLSYGVSGNLTELYIENIEGLTNETTSINSSRLGVLNDLYRNLSSTSLVVESINVSDIVEIMLSRNGSTNIDTIVQILLVLDRDIPLEETLAHFVVVLAKIIVAGDIYLLKVLVPELNVNVNVDDIVDALRDTNRLLANPGRTLSHIEVVGPILEILSASLTVRSGRQLDLNVILASCISREILRSISYVVQHWTGGRPARCISGTWNTTRLHERPKTRHVKLQNVPEKHERSQKKERKHSIS